MVARDAVLDPPQSKAVAPERATAPPVAGPLGLTGAGDQPIGVDLLLGLQATAGNAGVGRLLARWSIQREGEPDAGASATATLPPDAAGGVADSSGGVPVNQALPAQTEEAGTQTPGGIPGGTLDPGGTPAGRQTPADARTPGGIPGGTPGPTDTPDGGAPGRTESPDGGTPNNAGQPQTPPAPPRPPPAGDRLGSLDERVKQLMEQRQDPAAAKEHEALLGKAELTRLAALQYNYAPNRGLLMGLLVPLLPLDQMGERITSLWSGNQYSSGAANSTVEKVQAVIEGLRQALRLVADVVSAGATVLSYVGLIAGVIAFIPPATPVAAPIAAFSASMSLTLTGIKVLMDLFDALLGIVQGVILIVRARFAKGDPVERAKIAMMLRREAGEVSSSLINAGIGAATWGLGKYAQRLAPKGEAAAQAVQAAAVQSGLVAAGRQLVAGNVKAALVGRATWAELSAVSAGIRKGQAAAKGVKVPSMARNAAINRVVFKETLRKERAAAKLKKQKSRAGSFHAGAKVFVVGKLRTTLAPKIPSLAVKPWAPGAKFLVGQGRKQSAVQGDSAKDAPKPDEPGAATDQPGASEVTYHYWPSVIERYKQMRKDLRVARERAQEKHDRAVEDAGASGQAVLTIKGAKGRAAGKLGAAGQKVGAQAGADERAAGDQAAQAKKGKDQEAKATAKAKGSEADRANAGKDAERANEEAIAAAESERKQPSFLGKLAAMGMKKVGDLFKSMQLQLTEWILSAAMAAAGLDPKELDVANLHTGAEKDKETAGQAKEDADGMSEEEQRQIKAMQQLLSGAGDSEQNAIRGVADTLDYIRDLDAWDEILADAEQGGTAYIEALMPLLGAQTGPSDAQLTIDSMAVDPVIQATDYVTAASQTGAAGFESACNDALEQKLGEVQAFFGEFFESVDTSQGTLVGGQFVQTLSLDLHKRLADNGQAAAQIVARTNALIGTADVNGLAAAAMDAEALAADVDDAYTEAQKAFDAMVQELLDAYTAAAVAAIEPAAEQSAAPSGESAAGDGIPADHTPADPPPANHTAADGGGAPAALPATGGQ